ncbi:toprim domain-containing protein [Candidatus Woesearchaeota archaeon]|nr:toprim domain-containing protein [Candidatus Woesearchaeota archaeon]
MAKNPGELMDWIERIRSSDQIVVVEGKEDKAALNRLGIRYVVQLNKKPLYKIVEELVERGKGVLILTDLDKKGKQLYGKLNHDLCRFGVKVDNRFRNFLFRHTKLRQIEGLDSYVERDGLKRLC